MQLRSFASGLPARFVLVALGLTSLDLARPNFAHAQVAGTKSYVLDVTGVDPAVTPGASFYSHVNGGWAQRTEIPPDHSRWGVDEVLSEEVDRRTVALLEAARKPDAAADADARKAGDFFAAYLDEAAIEARGLAPLQDELGRIAALADRTALARWLGGQLRADVDPLNNTQFHTDRLFGLWVSADFNRPGRRAPYLLQGGLNLPDRAYYLDPAPRMAEIRAQYLAHVTKVLELAGIPDAAAKAGRIVALERAIAEVHVSREDSADVQKANHPWRRAEFATRAPGLDWGAFFRAAQLDGEPVVIVWHPGAITGLAALAGREPLATWREYLTFHALDRRSSVLPRAFVAEHFAFYEKILAGTPELSPRWKRAVRATNGALGDAVGRLYVQRHFPAASKAQVAAMVKNIVAAFGARIDRLEWMAPVTKVKAREKLKTLHLGVGYPEHWISYAGLKVSRGDALGNVERAGLFEYHRRLAQLRQRVDVGEWWMVPQLVNAVNLPLQNAINFPAAILQPPYFDPSAPAAVNYGAIGAVIGHEISHSFDDQGAQFDAHGQLADWWTPEDLAHFQRSAAQLAAQFDAYRPFPDLAVNGKQTLSENIADLAGLAVTHDAWRLSLGEQPAPVLAGHNGEQQFFLSYALSWREKSREADLRQQIITDGHAPVEYRVNTVRNLDAWYPAFDVQPGAPLFLPAAERVRVW